MRAGFESIHAKLDAILHIVNEQYRHHDKIVDHHEDRTEKIELDLLAGLGDLVG